LLAVIEGWQEVEGLAAKLPVVLLEPEVHHSEPPSKPKPEEAAHHCELHPPPTDQFVALGEHPCDHLSVLS
jgi:hypothetical protein